MLIKNRFFLFFSEQTVDISWFISFSAQIDLYSDSVPTVVQKFWFCLGCLTFTDLLPYRAFLSDFMEAMTSTIILPKKMTF